MNKEELKKIIVEKIKELLYGSLDHYTDETLNRFADNIISKILPDGMLIKIIDKEQEFWD